MTPIKFFKRISLSFLYLATLLTLTGCFSKSNHFGIIYTIDKDIYRIPDNTKNNVDQLTFTPSIGEYQILISENGDNIIFRAGFGENENESSEKPNHIYLLNTENKEFVDITNILVEYSQVWDTFSMDWSSDQKQFVVNRAKGQGDEFDSYLEFISFSGNFKERISIETIGEIPALIQSAKLSPDGNKVVLTQGVIGLENQLQYPGSAILTYDLESKEITQLTTYEDHCLPQEWSPTSQKIAVTCSFIFTPYSEGEVGPSTVKILDVENPGQANELIGISPCRYPSWAPDGKRIAILCKKDIGQDGLFILNTENYEIHEVMLDNPVVLKSLAWSPNGKNIIYAAGPDREHLKIYSIQSDGSNKNLLTSEEGAYSIISVYPMP